MMSELLDLVTANRERRAAAPALGRPGRPFLDYASLHSVLLAMGETLGSLGLARGDRIALHLPDALQAAVAFLAVAARAVCAPMNPRYRPAEVDFHLADLDVSALVVPEGEDPPALDVAARLGVRVLRLTCDERGVPIALRADSVGRRRTANVATTDQALVLHTSGTTSRPKIVPLSHANLVGSARGIARSLALGPEDRCLNVMPLFHVHGLVGALLASLAAGSSVALPSEFDPTRFFEWLSASEATWYTAVPTIHQAVVAMAPQHAAILSRRRLRFVRSSSAALPPTVMAALEGVFGAPIVEAYGMTEASHQIATNPLPPRVRKPGSVGLPAGPEVAILGEEGTPLPREAQGEICIRGETVVAAYERSDEANRQAFREGWLRTGDQGWLDADGYLYISGRLKEMINRGGEKVSPLEVEAVLLQHEAIAEAAVFSVPHPTLGEDVAAAVVPRPGATVVESTLRQWLQGRLTDSKVPQQIVIVDALPHGPTGKVQRRGLAWALKDRLGAPFVAPRTSTEHALAEIWREVLGIGRIGVLDNFIAVGGDSLKIVLVAARARSRGLKLAAADLFQNPTIAGCAEVLERSAPEAKAASAAVSPGADGVGERYPLTPHQQVLLRFQQSAQVPRELLFLTELDVKGQLDVERLHEAWRQTVQAHPILRTAFEGPVQIVRDKAELDWHYLDVSSEAATRRSERARIFVDAGLDQGMAADRAPLVRVRVIRLEADAFLVACIWHHAIMDLWVALRVLREVFARHAALASGRSLVEPPPGRPFRDYVEWIHARQQSAAAKAFWRHHLEGVSANVAGQANLPAAWVRSRQARPSGVRKTRLLEVPREVGARLVRFGSRHGLTLGTLFYGAWALLQSRLQDSREVLFATTTSGRWAELDGVSEIVGPVFATQPFRVSLATRATAIEWLTALQAAHGEVQRFDFVGEESLRKWAGSLPPSWCVLIFQNLPSDLWSLDTSGLEISDLRCDVWLRRPLAIFFFPSPDGRVRIQLGWDPARFRDEEIAWIGDGFLGALERVMQDPSATALDLMASLPPVPSETRGPS